MKKYLNLEQSWKIDSIVSAVFGIVCILWTDWSISMMLRAAGIVLLVYGIVEIITARSAGKEKKYNIPQMILGIVLLAGGLFLLARPDFLTPFMPVVFGVILIGINAFMLAFTNRNEKYLKHTPAVLCSMGGAVLGTVVSSHVFVEVSMMSRLAGIGFVLTGAALFLFMFERKKKTAPDIPEQKNAD